LDVICGFPVIFTGPACHPAQSAATEVPLFGRAPRPSPLWFRYMADQLRTEAVPNRLELRYRTSDDVAVIDVVGEADIETCGELRERLLLAVSEEGQRGLVINLGDLGFIDSTGIGVFVGLWHRVQAAPGALALAELSAQARTAFSVMGLYKILPIYDTEAEAVAACREQAAGAQPAEA
jgi:anti-sigma B factor antagonist